MNTYLDDPEFDWFVDPDNKPWVVEPEGKDLETLMDELCERNLHEEAIRTILLGYAGLKQRRPDITDEQALHTSMVWYFG